MSKHSEKKMNVHKNIQIAIIKEYRKQKILTFKNLDSDYFGNCQELILKIRAVLNTNVGASEV